MGWGYMLSRALIWGYELNGGIRDHAGLGNIENLALPQWRHVAEHCGHSVRSPEIRYVLSVGLRTQPRVGSAF